MNFIQKFSNFSQIFNKYSNTNRKLLFNISTKLYTTTVTKNEEADANLVSEMLQKSENVSKDQNIRKNFKGKLYKPVDLATSLDYLSSDVYNDTYRGKPVWFYYRRNFKGHFPPPYTRRNCVHNGKLISSNPCPICRDEYLILHYRHTELLKQFINPITSEIYQPNTTGLCQHQHKILLLEIDKARELGTIEMWLPFILYNYTDYYDQLSRTELEALLRINGQLSENHNNDQIVSSNRLAELPTDLQDLLQSVNSIAHAEEIEPGLFVTDIQKPKIPNRYKMEEDHKKIVAQRRRSHSITLTSVNDGHGVLNFIAPQTRLRVVDNSPWSSIAPSLPTMSTAKDQSGNKKKSVTGSSGTTTVATTNTASSGKDVKSKKTTASTLSNTFSVNIQQTQLKPALCIRVYNKQNKGKIGDKVLVAVGGQKKKGWIVGARLPSKNGWPRFESNNIVLVDDEGNPIGTKILVPIPARLKHLSSEITKIFPIASKFV